jgi:tRNA (guanine-N7-)-methyltransferase
MRRDFTGERAKRYKRRIAARGDAHFFAQLGYTAGMQTHRELIVEPIGLDPEKLPRPLSFSELFGNTNPVELEIGMGKGTFLTEQAVARPDVNFFGIEYARWFWRYASDRLRRHNCLNARTVRAEAFYFLREFVPDASIDVLHVYFPDPWPKKRHHKRRLINEAFMQQAMRILKRGGRLQVVTDHQGYFEEQIDPVIRSSPLKIVDYNRPGSAGEGEFVGTNFERKYRREGRPFYALAAMKVV